jgi:hypothetical protein
MVSDIPVTQQGDNGDFRNLQIYQALSTSKIIIEGEFVYMYS